MKRVLVLAALALSLAACSDATPVSPERATPSGPAFNHNNITDAWIEGESLIYASEDWDYHTWTAGVSGGTAPYTYEWAVDYQEVGGGFGGGGTGSTYTQGVDGRDGDFELRLKVTDANGHYHYAYHYVDVIDTSSGSCYPNLSC